MSDGVTVGGGGSIAVETPAMLTAASVLAEAHAAAHRLAVDLDTLPLAPGWAALEPAARATAYDSAQHAAALARRIAAAAGDTTAALQLAARRYGTVEHTVAGAVQAVTAAAASAWGDQLRVAVAAGPIAVVADLLATGAAAAAGLGVILLREQLARGYVDPINDPLVVEGIRLAIGSADDAIRGFFADEQPGDLIRDDPRRPFSTPAIASVLAVIAGVIGGEDPRVRVIQDGVTDAPMVRPQTLAELAARVPHANPDAPQVRVERYGDAASPHWIVYVGGTVTFSPFSGNEPFDMTSNLEEIAGVPAASEAGVIEAMQAAGVRPGQPVLMVGHSQGALAAERIAASRRFDVEGVVTLGGPTGQIALPKGLPVLAAENDEDLVPALGGVSAAGAAGLNRTVVRRRLYDDETPPHDINPVPAHATEEYERTLADADASAAPRVRQFEAAIAPFLEGDDGTAGEWRAVRATGVQAAPKPMPISPGSGR